MHFLLSFKWNSCELELFEKDKKGVYGFWLCVQTAGGGGRLSCINADISMSTVHSRVPPPCVLRPREASSLSEGNRPVSEQSFLHSHPRLLSPKTENTLIYAGATCQRQLVLCVDICISLRFCYPAPQRVQALLQPSSPVAGCLNSKTLAQVNHRWKYTTCYLCF